MTDRHGSDAGASGVQLAFEDVVDMEPQPGDVEYTLWLSRGRPTIDAERINAHARTGKTEIETLPGL